MSIIISVPGHGQATCTNQEWTADDKQLEELLNSLMNLPEVQLLPPVPDPDQAAAYIIKPFIAGLEIVQNTPPPYEHEPGKVY